MKSIKNLYRIGKGPSSSHSMGPQFAAQRFLEENKGAKSFSVTLYGSLAKTGKGHGTDVVLKSVLGDKTEIIFDEITPPPHPNTMDFTAVYDDREVKVQVFSVGGGAIVYDGVHTEEEEKYPHSTFSDIRDFCMDKEIRLSDYVYMNEPDVKPYLYEVWEAMKSSIKSGLKAKGILPGGLGVERKAGYLYRQHHIGEGSSTKENRLVCSYAFAVSEQNASGGTIVTAPTCGACGVLPAVLYYMQDKFHLSTEKVISALAVGGIIGNLIKTNASISGAECGCQAEIGSACAMAAGALGELFDLEIDQIEYAAEVAIEHHLGLTCDPVCGLVQIPCIERNAVAAMRAINAVSLADFLTYTRKISLDVVIQTMYETGRDLRHAYRETSDGGLAKLYKPKN